MFSKNLTFCHAYTNPDTDSVIDLILLPDSKNVKGFSYEKDKLVVKYHITKKEKQLDMLKIQIGCGDIPQAKKILDQIDLNEDILLFVDLLAEKGKLDLIKYLSKRVNSKEKKSFKVYLPCILECGCTYGHLKLVKYAIKKGIRASNNHNKPIKNASAYGHYKIVKYLIKKGADPKVDGGYCLIWSRAYGYTKIVKLLKKHGVEE